MIEAIASAALRTLVLALVVELFLRLLRVRNPQLLLAGWTAVLAASLAMPILQHFVLVTIRAPVELTLSPATIAPENTMPQAAALSATPIAGIVIHAALPWHLWATLFYFTVSGAMLLRLSVGLVLSWNLLRAARPAWDGWAAGARVYTSDRLTAPVTLGNRILLPLDCTDWSSATRQAVLAHERAHIAAGDFYVLLLSQVNRAVFWFSPVAWWLHRRLTMLAESASDDAAIELLGDPSGYAAILLDMTRRSGPILGGMAMARPETICRRIERVLSEPSAPRASGIKRAAFALGVTPLALTAALSIDRAAPADDAAIAEQLEPHAPIAVDPKWLDAYAGFYFDSKTGSLLQVSRDGDHLLTRWAGRTANADYPYTDHDFFLTVAPVQNSFATDASGAVTGVVHHEKGESETLARIGADEGRQLATAIAQRLSDERKPRVPIKIDPALLDHYVGTYELTPQVMFTITRSDDALFARRTGQLNYRLHAYSDRDFFYTVVAAQMSFVAGAGGNADAFILHQNGQDRRAVRVDPTLAQALDRQLAEEREPHTRISIDPRLIDAYVGRYRNSELEIVANREGNQLFAQVTGYARYAVYPYTDHDFFATLVPAQISFVTNDGGMATQLVRHEHGVDAVLDRVE